MPRFSFNLYKLMQPEIWYRLIGVVLLIAFFLGMVGYVTAQPFFCNTCHEIKPYFDSWKTSTHADVNCLSCHAEAGFTSALQMRVDALQHAFTHVFSGKNVKRLGPSLATESGKTCLACHIAERDITPSGDLIIPHPKHIRLKGIACSDCHVNLVHHRKGSGKNLPAMEICYKCHDGVRISNKCVLCHSEKGPPEDHKNKWVGVHGSIALQGRSECLSCHSKPKDFCKVCHRKIPPSHNPDWSPYQHSLAVKSGGEAPCLTCHNKKTFCQKCHQVQHPSDYSSTHRATVESEGSTACVKCHVERKLCVTCHQDGKNPGIGTKI